MRQPSNLNIYPVFTVCLVALLTRHHLPVHGSVIQSAGSLYHSNDNVIILTTDNFTKFVVDLHQDGQKLQLIQFYNSWCGHCISFAPNFKKFLKSVDKWKDLLSISVVDCSMDINFKLCTDYDISFYPNLRMFWFKPTSKDKGDTIKCKFMS